AWHSPTKIVICRDGPVIRLFSLERRGGRNIARVVHITLEKIGENRIFHRFVGGHCNRIRLSSFIAHVPQERYIAICNNSIVRRRNRATVLGARPTENAAASDHGPVPFVFFACTRQKYVVLSFSTPNLNVVSVRTESLATIPFLKRESVPISM